MATIQGIYIALFGRPADPIGLAFFNEATNNGADLTAIGDLAGTAEYQSRFEGMNSAQIVTAIYQSLFGRNPELAGLEFFVAQLESGAQNINTIAINILDGAQNEDADVVANKIAAAEAWTAAVAADPDALAAYQGDAGIAAGQAYLANITDDESTIPSAAQLNAQLAALIAGEPPAPVPGDTFTLTDAVGENVVGTANNDEFRAVFDTNNSADGTLNVGDAINGMGGTDTLNLTMVGGAAAALPAGVSIQNVEIINLITAEAGSTLDVGFKASQFEGATQVWQVNEAVDIAAVGAGVTAGFRDTALADVSFTSATGSVAVENATGGATLNGKSATVELETVNISGSQNTAETLTFTAGTDTDVTTLNVSLSGKQTAIAGDILDDLETFDGSGSSAGLTVDLTDSADLETATFGSGKDDVTIALNDQDQEINTGAGNDLVTIQAAGAVDGTLSITLGAGADILALDTALGNVGGTTAGTFADNLISVTDFNISQDDVLDLSGAGITEWATQGLVNGAIDGATSLFAALDAVADLAATTATAAAQFVYDGNLYIYQDVGGDGLTTTDTLIELQGVTTLLTDANVVFA